MITTPKERAARSCRLPGAELAGRVGGHYAALADALMAQDPVGMAEQTTVDTGSLDPLTFETDADRQVAGYRLGDGIPRRECDT